MERTLSKHRQIEKPGAFWPHQSYQLPPFLTRYVSLLSCPRSKSQTESLTCWTLHTLSETQVQGDRVGLSLRHLREAGEDILELDIRQIYFHLHRPLPPPFFLSNKLLHIHYLLSYAYFLFAVNFLAVIFPYNIRSVLHTYMYTYIWYIYMLPLPYCNPPAHATCAHTHTHAQPMSVCVCVWGGTVIGRRWQPNHHCKVLLIYQSERSTHWHRKYETQIYRKTRKEEESYGSACSALREQKKPPNKHTQKNQKDVVTT